MPAMGWECSEAEGVCRLVVTSEAKPKRVRVWTAEADTRDFRKARWAEDGKAGPDTTVAAPARGYRAFFAETEYELDGLTFTLCTQLRILEAKK